MRSSFWVVAILVVSCFPLSVFAQTAQQVRQQLEELQRKLETLEQQDADAPNRRVTELGSKRPAPRKDEQPTQVTRLYDLSDLFAVAPPYTARQPSITGYEEEVFSNRTAANMSAGGGFGGNRSGGFQGGGGLGGGGFGGGGGVFSIPASLPANGGSAAQPMPQFGHGGESSNAGARTSLDQLIEAIKTAISPDEWKSGKATIANIGASLVVSASPDTHSQITALLDLFRKRWGTLRTVSVRVWWLWLNETQVAEALEKDAVKGKLDSPFGIVDDAAWAKLRKAAADEERSGYQAVITCYNGQTVSTLAGEHRLVVTGLTPTLISDEEKSGVGYEPTLTTIQEGAALQITPLATRHAKYLVMDIHSRVNLLQPNANAVARPEKLEPNDPFIVTSAIERPALQSQRLSTTLRVPVDKLALVGGMTFGSVKGQSLYLFVQGNVQELRDDDPAELEAGAGPQPGAGLRGDVPELETR